MYVHICTSAYIIHHFWSIFNADNIAAFVCYITYVCMAIVMLKRVVVRWRSSLLP